VDDSRCALIISSVLLTPNPEIPGTPSLDGTVDKNKKAVQEDGLSVWF